MGLVLKEVTGREIFEAIEKNGIRVVRDNCIDDEGDKIGACILGIAALNLGVTSATTHQVDSKYDHDTLVGHSLEDQLNRFRTADGREVGKYIWQSFDEQVYFEDDIPEHPDYVAEQYDEDTDEWTEDNYNKIYEKIEASLDPSQISNEHGAYYKLSWKDAVLMAHDVLEPLFDEKFQVAVEDYKELYDWTPPA